MTTITETARALAAEQERVAAIVSALTAAGWRAELSPAARERLLVTGHFPAYATELDWTPREVVGHLRDSARIFAERIGRLRTEDRPRFPDFVTDDPGRLADYRTTSPGELRQQLRTAQAGLLAAVEAVPPGELSRVGEHEVEGELTLGQVLAFLPGHQRDHREQLAALTAEELA